jgi:hypothetical protein
MSVGVLFGSELEARRDDGTLRPLSDKEIAANAFRNNGVVFAPCQTWEKDFPGQVTAGRIGRPVIRYCPLDWHGSRRADRIRRRIASQEGEG